MSLAGQARERGADKAPRKVKCGASSAPRAASPGPIRPTLLAAGHPPALRDARKRRQQSLLADATPPPCSEATSRRGLAPSGGPFWTRRAGPVPDRSDTAPPTAPEKFRCALRSLMSSGAVECKRGSGTGDKYFFDEGHGPPSPLAGEGGPPTCRRAGRVGEDASAFIVVMPGLDPGIHSVTLQACVVTPTSSHRRRGALSIAV
jgi:hypothetical protein